MNNFAPENLLLYHYGELDPERIALLEKSLVEDWTLQEKYAVLKEAIGRLDNSMYRPRQQAIDRIMEYASSRIKHILTE